MKHTPQYKKIFQTLRQEIEAGVYQDGEKLSSESELAARFTISIITIKHALSLLSEEGLIRRVQGNGTFVTLTENEDAAAARKPMLIGVIMSGASDAFGSGFIFSVCEEARKFGCGVLLGIRYSSQKEEAAIINQIIRNGAQGVIIMPLHAQAYNVELFRHAINGYPFVQADRYLEGLNMPYVCSNNEQAAFNATQYLFSIGHKHIAYFSPTGTSSALAARRSGYIRAYAEHSIPLDPSLIFSSIQGLMPEFRGKCDVSDDMQRIRQFFLSHPEITALVAADSPTAILIEEALGQISLRVPDDISIVCFDAYDSPVKTSHFTHIRQDEAQMGKLAFRRLYEQITGRPVESRTLLETKLVLGRSSMPLSEEKNGEKA